MLPREALDPEIREAVRDIPDFVFSVETVPMMRQNAVFSPVAAPDIERIELTTEPDGGVDMTVLRPRDAVGDLPVLYWMHGGGTVIGNRYMDDARLGEWCRSLSLRLRQRRIPTRAGSAISGSHRRLRPRACATSSTTRPSCGSIRAASASPAAARVADWPPLSRSVGATGATIVSPSNTWNIPCSMTA